MTKSAPVPSGYLAALTELKQQVRNARFSAQRRVNTDLVRLYWGIGSTILQRQEQEGWGTNVIGGLAGDLRAEFPEMKGFSRANLFYMRRVAAAWPDEEVVQQLVGQLPWGHITVLLDRLDALRPISGHDVGGRRTKDPAAALVGGSVRSIDRSGVRVRQDARQRLAGDEDEGDGRHAPREHLRTSNLTHASSLP